MFFNILPMHCLEGYNWSIGYSRLYETKLDNFTKLFYHELNRNVIHRNIENEQVEFLKNIYHIDLKTVVVKHRSSLHFIMYMVNVNFFIQYWCY